MRLLAAFLGLSILLAQLPPVAAATAAHVVISEVQLAGGTTDDEFVELYNPTTAAISLAGYRLTRRTSTGTESNLVASFSAVIAAHGFLLITPPTGCGVGCPAADVIYSATTNRLAANNAVVLYADAGITVVDKVGLGSANTFEMTATASPTAGQTVERKSAAVHDAAGGNGEDADNNVADFFLQTAPNPQNAASVAEPLLDTTAPTVTASSTGGTFVGTQTVSLSTNESATIYYTLDGSMPTTGSMVYGASLIFTATTTLQFFARDTAGNSSAITAATFTLAAPLAGPDTTAPTDGGALTATAGDASAVLGWPAATDDTSVANYQLFISTDGGSAFDAGTNLGNVTSHTISSITNNTTYTFKVVACDLANNCSTGIAASATPTVGIVLPPAPPAADTAAPIDGGALTATTGDQTVALGWPAATDDTAVTDYQLFLSLDGGSTFDAGTSLGNVNSYIVSSLTPNTNYTFKITACDVAGNCSLGTSASATPFHVFIAATAGEVLINEIAWVGSSISSSDEWLELYNNSNKTFDLVNWKLGGATGGSGADLVLPAMQLAPGGYFVVGNNAATHVFTAGESALATDPNFISASFSLSNSNLQVLLQDAAGNLLDTAGDGGAPLAGDAATPASMLRLPSFADGALAGSWRAAASSRGFDVGLSDRGSPGTVNFLPTDGAVASLTANVVAPLPGENVLLTTTVENVGTAALTGSLEFFAGDPAAGGALLGTAAVDSLASFATQTFTQIFAATAGETTFFARLMAAEDGDAANDSATLFLNVAEHVVISEYLPDPAGSDTAGEWVELFNPTSAAVELTGYRLGGATVGVFSLPAGAYAMLYSDPARGGVPYTGSWTTLTNTNATLNLTNAAGQTVDSVSYTNTTETRSYGRLPISLPTWQQFWHPTPGAVNTETNTAPTAQITVQSASSCSLSVNLDGSGSLDADGDALTFFWQFGDGNTSTASNPSYHTYSQAGSYVVSLTVTDTSHATATATQTFAVASCGGVSSTANTVATPKVPPEPEIPSISASAVRLLISEVAFDSSPDFVEIFVADDGKNGAGMELGGFQLVADQNVKTLPRGLVAKTGDFITVTFAAEGVDDLLARRLFSAHGGLVKTDEQLALRDSAGTVEDAVIWENDGKWSRGEERDAAVLVAAGGWSGAAPSAAVASADWQRKNVLARRLDTADTNTAADFFATPFATPGAPNGWPPTAAKPGFLLLTAVDFKNPAGDSVQITCPGCAESGTPLAGFFLKFGPSKLLDLPADLVLKKGEMVQLGGVRGAQFTGQFYPLDLQLTGTDGLLTVKDFANTTADFVCWTDRAAPPSRAYDLTLGEVEQLQKRLQEGEWAADASASCLDSNLLQRGDRLQRLETNGLWTDTQTAADFAIVAGDADVPQTLPQYFAGVHLSEVLPNPAGADSGAEWVEVANLSDVTVELLGWQMTAGRGAFTFEDSFVLQPGEFKKVTGLTLPNGGATLALLPPAPGETESVVYPKLPENGSFAWDGAHWSATQLSTPDAANAFFTLLKRGTDTDGDGLADTEEAVLKTDALKYDTDGDALPDAFELHHGRDPRVPTAATAADLVAYRQLLGTLAVADLQTTADEQTGVTAAGWGVPGGTATVFLHSQLQVFTVPVAAAGRWSFTLDAPLESGEHRLDVQLTDPAGIAGNLATVLHFRRATPFTPRGFGADLLISEIFAAPEGADKTGEWFELWNRGDAPLDLTDLTLQIGKHTQKLPSYQLPAHGLLVLGGRDFAGILPPGTPFLRLAKNLQLPNSGGTLALQTPAGRVLFAGTYAKLNAKTAAIWVNGGYRVTARPTPGAANVLVNPPQKRGKKSKVIYQNGVAMADIVLSEVLANPAGSDTKTEWIEIWNRGDRAVQLGNWTLDDLATGGSKPWKIPDKVWLVPGAYHVFSRAQTKLSLNNTGREEVVLRSWTGAVVDRWSFENPGENVALAHDTDGTFRATRLLTFAAANAFDTQKLLARVVGRTADGVLLAMVNEEIWLPLGVNVGGLAARSLFLPGTVWQVFINAKGDLAAFEPAAGGEAVATFRLSPEFSARWAWLIFITLVGAAGFGWRAQKWRGKMPQKLAEVVSA